MVEQLKLLLDAARERVRQADEVWSECDGSDPTGRYYALVRAKDLESALSQAYEAAVWVRDNP